MDKRGNRKIRMGRVVNDKADNTITVMVQSLVRHPLYKKTLKQTKKYMADDPKNEAKIGDLVEIMETRPLSKLKHWRLDKIIEKAEKV